MLAIEWKSYAMDAGIDSNGRDKIVSVARRVKLGSREVELRENIIGIEIIASQHYRM
jgi:hypothetical protein